MRLLPAYSIVLFITLLFGSVFVFSKPQVFAQTQQQIEQERSQKQRELEKIRKDISSIASSNASLTTKLTALRAEKSKMQKLLDSMSQDVKIMEVEAKKQEEELIAIANTYSLQQALYTIESQKNILVTLFESPTLSNVLDRFLYYNVQSQSMKQQQELIELKLEAIESKRKYIAQEEQLIQKSLSEVTGQIASLEDQQARVALELAKNYAQRNSLVADISKLSRAAQAIINSKTTGGSSSSGNSTGSGTGGGASGGTNTNTSGAISIIIDGTVFKKTNAVVRVSAANDEIVLKGSRTTEFAGVLEFNKSSGMYAINELSMDKYLWGLAEMPSSWPAEALRVQAIAGRSYATYKMRYGGYGKFDIYDSTQDQEYVGLGKVKSSFGNQWKDAVTSTTHKVMEYGGKTILAIYSSDAAGHTLASNESPSFGGTLAYLSAKQDRYLEGGVWKNYGNSNCGYWIIQGNLNPFPWCGVTRRSEGINTLARMEDYLNGAIYYQLYGKMVTTGELSPTALKNHLTSKNQSIINKVGTITDIRHEYDHGGDQIVQNTKFTKSIIVTGTTGSVTLSGPAFRVSYNVRAPYKNAVYSTLFDIKKVDMNNWELWTRGFGHRVGMSQHGAYGRALAGQTHEQILKHYYNNANVVQYNVGRNIRVGLTKVGSRVMEVSAGSEMSIYEGGTLIKKVSPSSKIKIEYN